MKKVYNTPYTPQVKREGLTCHWHECMRMMGTCNYKCDLKKSFFIHERTCKLDTMNIFASKNPEQAFGSWQTRN